MAKKMKRGTRPGDSGTTVVPSVGRVAKSDPRVVALGDLDELNCALGLLAVKLKGSARAAVTGIQEELFDAGADVASPRGGRPARLTSSCVAELDRATRSLERRLSPLRGFVVPGANEADARCHLARAVARRAERAVSTLPSAGLNPEVARYLNRLSSYLFALARTLAGKRARTVRV